MATTIRTSSKNYFTKIQKYLNNKRVFFTSSLNLGVYVLTIFDLAKRRFLARFLVYVDYIL